MVDTATARPIPEWAAQFWRGTKYAQQMASIDCDLCVWSLCNARDAIGPGEHSAFLLTVNDYAKHWAMWVCYQMFGRYYLDEIRIVHTPLIPEDAWALENGASRYITNGA